MRKSSTITGVLVALIVGLLVHVINSASYEVKNALLAAILIVPVGYLGIRYRINAKRDERLVRNGLNHYRQHIHQRRLIKKTS